MKTTAMITGYGDLYDDYGMINAIVEAMGTDETTLTFKGPEAIALPFTLRPGDIVDIDGHEEHNTIYVRNCRMVHAEGGLSGRNISICV